MKYIYSFIAALVLCVLSFQTNGQQNSEQCSYEYPTFCGIVATMTYPCSWGADEDLVYMLEVEVDDYYCRPS